MGYDLMPRNKKAGTFWLGIFPFQILQEACGYLWPCISKGVRWYCVFGADPRMPVGDNYPRLLSNDGFRITAEEARIMARIARNFVEVQRSLSDERTPSDLTPVHLWPWPIKIYTDFVDKFEQFADWAERSQGFAIW